MSSKTISLIIIAIGIIVAGVIIFSGFGESKENAPSPLNLGNVFIQGGKQTVDIIAKGGFEPETSIAKSGVPTVLRITTKGTFDCSSVVNIPELGVRKNLPVNGVTEIDLGTRAPGTLNGSCGMGMYPFTIEFK
ncbi:MAG: cupredoxin domain-containing protein [Candidatus Paceibacterota bacterium]|jgi:plastocyanin domain-containing protein|nr:cupredoxin domain-containing protein [Candidatus Paceibacterota bacterium]